MFQVQAEKCNQCLFSKDKIVGDKRRSNLIKKTLQNDTYFVCHKGSINKQHSLCCRGFWDAFKDQFNLGRIAQRLGGPKFVKIE